MRLFRLCFLFSVLVLACFVQAQPRTAELSIGDKAPPLKLETWIKGPKVSAFQPGQVYVIEFWATWCGPCIQAMPELSSIADATKGKVSVIAVNVWDRTDPEKKNSAAHTKRISAFVQQNSKNMRFRVATDTQAGFMAKAWLAAAKQNGIPASFIVDQKGRVAWIGHPQGMQTALEKVLKGKLDLAKTRKEFDTANIRAKTKQTQNERLAAAAAKNDEATFYKLFMDSGHDSMSRVMNALNVAGVKHPDFLMAFFDRRWSELQDMDASTWPLFIGMIIQNSKSPATINLAFKRAEEGYKKAPADMRAYSALFLAEHYAFLKQKDKAQQWVKRCEADLPTVLPSIRDDVTEKLAQVKKRLAER